MTGQNGQAAAAQGGQSSRAVVAVAGLLAVVLLSAVGVAALRSGAANADTVLAAGSDAVLVLPGGASRPAVVGERVPRGATVRAGVTGARLDTRDRRVFLGRDSAVTVVDGARQRLGAGFVFVDATDGPGVELATPAAVVTAVDSSLVRVDGGPLLRVGVLRGAPASVRAVGRRAASDVPRYYQAQVAPGGLPSEASPLLLTGDSYEQLLARELYDADRDLNALARRLDMAGSAGPVVLSVLSRAVSTDAAVAGAPASERALGFLMATAADASQVSQAYARVRALRTAGGSWGVVSAIVGATPNDVSAVLGALLDPGAPALAAGPDGAVDLAALAAAVLGDGVPVVLAASPVPDPTSGPGGSGPSPAPSPGGGGGPSPSPSPSPSRPSTGVPVVDAVVDTVLDLLDPSPSAVPVAPPLPRGPAATASPSPALLGIVPLPLLN